MLETTKEHIMHCMQHKLMYETIHVFLYFLVREHVH